MMITLISMYIICQHSTNVSSVIVYHDTCAVLCLFVCCFVSFCFVLVWFGLLAAPGALGAAGGGGAGGTQQSCRTEPEQAQGHAADGGARVVITGTFTRVKS